MLCINTSDNNELFIKFQTGEYNSSILTDSIISYICQKKKHYVYSYYLFNSFSNVIIKYLYRYSKVPKICK